MRDRPRGRQSGVHRWLGVLVAIAASLALNVSPAAADGVGSASARGTDPDGRLTTPAPFPLESTVQYSAITNCDETQNTRPFIVRGTLGSDQVTVTRTSTETSTCTTENGRSVNEGTGRGTVSGRLTGDAFISWRFEDSPDHVTIDIFWNLRFSLHASGAPQAVSGTPGGVWVFGELPWPAGGGV
jgi:hypothetical protein